MSREISFDATMDRILNNISDKYDKRETSLIYQATAMVVPELLLLRSDLELIEDESFPDTCNYNNLVRFARERNIEPRLATHGMVEAEFNIEIELDMRFNHEKRNYRVYEQLPDVSGKKRYSLLAEETGHIESIGDLIPMDEIPGLEVAKIIRVMEDGKEDESLESLRSRYLSSLNYQGFGGNRQDYIDKILELDNIGTCKVFRREPATSSELGKVEVLILDTTYKESPEDLIKSTQDYLDPRNDSAGYGVAPIGHLVTVKAVNKVNINIHTNLTLERDVDITEDIKRVVEEYLHSLRINFGSTDGMIVRLSQIENKILDVSGVIDIRGTTLNGSESNVVIDSRSIPVLGGVTYDKQ